MTSEKRCILCKRVLPRECLQEDMQRGTGLCGRCLHRRLNQKYARQDAREWLRVWRRRLADAIRVTLE